VSCVSRVARPLAVVTALVAAHRQRCSPRSGTEIVGLQGCCWVGCSNAGQARNLSPIAQHTQGLALLVVRSAFTLLAQLFSRCRGGRRRILLALFSALARVPALLSTDARSYAWLLGFLGYFISYFRFLTRRLKITDMRYGVLRSFILAYSSGTIRSLVSHHSPSDDEECTSILLCSCMAALISFWQEAANRPSSRINIFLSSWDLLNDMTAAFSNGGYTSQLNRKPFYA
jgi:hypothetical protein